MRTIKFRGQKIKGKKWVYGYYVHFPLIGSVILNRRKNLRGHQTDTVDEFEVIDVTVGQYTGFNDKNGKEIYEGDILNCSKVNYKLVRHISGAYELYKINDNGKTSCSPYFLFQDNNKCEIIGNIHKNPELLTK